MAYRNYSKDGNLPIYDKNAHIDYQDSGNCGKIFKVNGSANFDDFCMVDYISKHRDVDSVIQLIEYYDNLVLILRHLAINLPHVYLMLGRLLRGKGKCLICFRK